MTFLAGLLIWFAGAFMGFFLSALFCVGKMADMRAEEEFRQNWGIESMLEDDEEYWAAKREALR